MEAVTTQTNAHIPPLNVPIPKGVVHKYGGSSVASIDKIKAAAERVAEVWRAGTPIAVVASAMGKSTDGLIALANETGGAANARELDQLLATGEQQTVALFAMALLSLGVPAASFTGPQCGLMTNSNHSRARITAISGENVIQCILDGGVPVVAGFQGVCPDGAITTLGRGGSDTTAVALAARLGWDCDIYTDVDGVYTSDPRQLNGVKRLSRIPPDVMAELSAAGAGVLETRSVELAGKYGVRLFLGRSLERDRSKGTYIMEDNNAFESAPVSGVGSKPCALVRASGVYGGGERLAGLLSILAKADIRADMLCEELAGDRFTLSFACAEGDAALFEESASKSGAHCAVERGLARVTAVGRGFSTHSDMSGRAFSALLSRGVPALKSAVSGISAAFIVRGTDAGAAVAALAIEFGLAEEQIPGSIHNNVIRKGAKLC